MQLGIGSYTYGWAVGVSRHPPENPLTELDLLDKAKAAGLKLVQFGDNLPLHTLSQERLFVMKDRATADGITLELGARGLTTEHLNFYVELCRFLGVRLLRFVIDAPDYEPEVKHVVELLRAHRAQLETAGITLGLENHDRLKAREFAWMMEQVKSPCIGICLDSVNSMGAGEGLEQIVDTLAPHTVNLHLKDFGIARLPHLMGFRIDGRPAGKGMLNVPWLLEKIRPSGRCHTAILEQWVVPEVDLPSTIRKEEAWARESLTYLKPWFEQ